MQLVRVFIENIHLEVSIFLGSILAEPDEKLESLKETIIKNISSFMSKIFL